MTGRQSEPHNSADSLVLTMTTWPLTLWTESNTQTTEIFTFLITYVVGNQKRNSRN